MMTLVRAGQGAVLGARAAGGEARLQPNGRLRVRKERRASGEALGVQLGHGAAGHHSWRVVVDAHIVPEDGHR